MPRTTKDTEVKGETQREEGRERDLCPLIATPCLELSLETGHSLRSSRAREAGATLVQPNQRHQGGVLSHFGTLSIPWYTLLSWYRWFSCYTWYFRHLGRTTATIWSPPCPERRGDPLKLSASSSLIDTALLKRCAINFSVRLPW